MEKREMKYYYNEDRLDPKLLPLYLIANELAEANRLKRIDLTKRGTITKDEA